ncbi:MAG TPA: NAD(P)-binding domain-containing protein [Devosiaceae bacterium]|nr:NAD(P)-binding domain-containing protein [Devosiaceae bacterium]
MKIGVLGTGVVGQTLGGKLVALGHDVMMGARSADNEKVLGFARQTGGKAGSFGDAIRHAEIVVNATRGDGAVPAIRQGDAWLDGKVLIDVSNPLDFSKGFPPSLSVSNTDSLGETIQRTFPQARVVKSLNTVTAAIMIAPGKLPGAHSIFVSGNDAEAKAQTADLLRSFGWQSIIDLGDITTARGVEQYVSLWVRLLGALGTAEFNIAVVK